MLCKHNRNYPTLNKEQKLCFDSIITETNEIGNLYLFSI
jgi:hypothetical protein